jgi:hypothetical protein
LKIKSSIPQKVMIETYLLYVPHNQVIMVEIIGYIHQW